MGELVVLGVVVAGMAAAAAWLVREHARDRRRRGGPGRRPGRGDAP